MINCIYTLFWSALVRLLIIISFSRIEHAVNPLIANCTKKILADQIRLAGDLVVKCIPLLLASLLVLDKVYMYCTVHIKDDTFIQATRDPDTAENAQANAGRLCCRFKTMFFE